MSAIIVPKRTLFPAIRERRAYERRARNFIFKYPARAGYRNTGSSPRGLHYGAPIGVGAFTREIFLVSNPLWVPPVGVISVDALLVAGGGTGGSGTGSRPTEFGALFLSGPGGGGGGIVVSNALPYTFPDFWQIDVAGANTASRIVNLTGFITLALAGPGGSGAVDEFNPAPAPSGNGSGAGGSFGPIAAGAAPYAPSLGSGPGGDGGNGDGVIGDFTNSASGGGGGAGGNGANGTAGPPLGQGVGGVGGAGAIPPPSSFGAWGNDIGEGGFFSGGGGGSTIGNSPQDGSGWTIAARGIGGGAANTGGGGQGALPPPDLTFSGVAGFSGIVVLIYATP